ncbi:MAG: sugar phosphate nucleotidyltransferase [Hyphomonadaceae bacterium]|nr:sugar phosphate nucleotidyltransferase [Hyphomonadaceae bacterium]
MAATKIFPVIMSGGSGTRLWPLSTETRPKQFHALGGAKSMIEETALRLSGKHGDIEFLGPIVIAGESHRSLVRELLARSGITPAALVFEPMGRNTAATAALAALVARELDPEAMVLLMPADHLVARPEALIETVRAAAAVASDRIVTFGITPSHPETGYGYIKQGAALGDCVHEVAAFKEKPKLPVAEGYIKEGGYSWNSGIFFFRPDVMLEEFSIASADIRDGAAHALKLATRKDREIGLDPAVFSKVRAEPVDIAVMEKTKRAAVAPCDIGWADVGSWAELWRLSEQDDGQNVVSGSVSVLDATGNLVRAEGIHVSVIGVSDLVIVATPDAVLVMPRDRAQDVKKVIPDKG